MHPAEAYIDGVLSGRVVTCRFARLAVERHVQDLKDGHERGLVFNRAAAILAIDFFKFLRHSKGEWAGEVFTPSPWQQFILWSVFGWYRTDGTRRFREVYEEVARKNGKSTKLAGVGLKLFFADGEPGAEVYTAATKRPQARITHSEAKRMVKKSPQLSKKIKILADNLHVEDSASKFEPLGADADSTDGLNVHGAIIDELHAHKTRDMADVLETATGSRRQPLIWYITTAGTGRETICWEKREYTRQVLTGFNKPGGFRDDSFFGIIFTLDLKADWPELLTVDESKRPNAPAGVIEDQWDDPKVWVKANPNLGISCKVDDLQRKALKAAQAPAALNAFQNKHLNVWTSQRSRWMPMNFWDLSAGTVDLEALKGKACYAGLDLAATTDLCALTLVFPIGNTVKVVPYFWIPEEGMNGDGMKERSQRDKVPYEVWVREKLIYATPGNTVDYDFILETLKELRGHYNIRELAFDRWGSPRIMKQLQDLSFTLVQFGQGYASMSAPMKEMLTMVLEGRFHHGAHPVLRWNADNVVVDRDPTDAIKPNKARAAARIDGIVAAAMALDRATRREDEPDSVYTEERGIITL